MGPEIAKELNIRSYQFFSCGATFARVLQAYPQLVEDGTLQLIADSRGVRSLAEFEGHLNIPGVPPLQFRDMMNARIMGAGFLISLGRAMAEADGLIINTFYELEAPEIDAIRQSWDEDHRGNIRKLFLYGPVSSGTTFKDPSVLAKSDNIGSECIQWLDNQPPQSVVYICFGGLVRLNPAQLRELALALEASGHGFLWVSPRAPPNEAPFKLEDILPPNFLTKVQGRGLTVQGWVPQLEILAHSSTAGFLTHCGWNSIIESINAGVPMIAWPQVPVDQPLNCRHVVDVLKIAVEVELTAKTLTGYNVGRRESSVSISTLSAGHVELEKALRLLMSEEGKAMRARVQELRMKAKAAVADGGPSKAALDELVDSIPTGLSSSLQHSHLKEDFAACQITV
ncbi:hypothetical protein Mapa_002836 [Marchantia paleacea]|nr:hypothetical protein Mapa_002836 [Marchantia paleacea]